MFKKILNLIIVCSCFSVYAGESNQPADVGSENESSVRGLVKPTQTAILSSGIGGRIKRIPFKSGDFFKKGNLLVEFDCDLYRADLLVAQANYDSKVKVHENNNKLWRLDAISDIEVSLSESDMKVADAEKQIKNIRVDQCSITAPFSGRVIDVLVNEYETVPENQELLSILNDKELEVELIVSSVWLSELDIGTSFEFLVDETEDVISGEISKISSTVDPVSQTVKLTGQFIDNTESLLSGMSGDVHFK